MSEPWRSSANLNDLSEPQRTSANLSEPQRTSANPGEPQRASANLSEPQRASANLSELWQILGNLSEPQPISKAGLIAGGRGGRETRHTVFFTPLDPWSAEEGEEEYCRDLTRPRKVHYKTRWKHRQNAVYWIHLGRAQAFWQTESHAIITNSGATRLYRTSDSTTRRNDYLPAILKTKTCATYCP